MLKNVIFLSLVFHVILSAFLPGAHEKIVKNGKWKKLIRAHPDQTVSITVALKQQNIDKLEKMVEYVSDPNSKSYGKYLSLEQVRVLVQPEDEVVNKVSHWILSFANNISIVHTRDFIVADASIKNIESHFGITMHHFQHSSGRMMMRTVDKVQIPSHISPHIDLITGLTDFFDYNHERKNLEKKAVQKTGNAPEFSVVRGSERDIIISVKVFCFNGTPSKIGTPCPGGYSPIVIEIFITDNFDVDKRTFQMVYDNENCKFSSESGITVCTSIFPVLAYERINISARVIYSQGVVRSDVGYYPVLFTPSPWITPQYLSNLYGVPKGYRQKPNQTLFNQNIQSVVAFELQYISLTDLSSFFSNMGLPYLAPIIRGQNDQSNPGGESTLDIQWVMGIGAGVNTIFWSVTGPGPAKPPGSGAYILDWAMQISNTTQAPLVTSISYGDTESGYYWKFGSYDYMTRMDKELAKMAVRGLTVIAGSGDAGASNVGEEGNDISNTDPTCTPLRAFYPSNSQYVLGVSSTFPSIYSKPLCSQQYSNRLQVTCSEVGEVAVDVAQGLHWTTGGGFSNVTARPSWQAQHVQQYLAILASQGKLPPKQYWNSAGRGYPDISTLGHNFVVYLGGALTPIGGTSSSGPALAGLLSLINGMLLEKGKPSLGLVNRALYSIDLTRPNWYFNDVIVGTNYNGDLQLDPSSPYATFCPYGYTTELGWDAVTGLGTPNFHRLAEYFTTRNSNNFNQEL